MMRSAAFLTATQPAVKPATAHISRTALLCVAMALTTMGARAQMSLKGAVGLAISSNPRVRGAEADLKKASAQLSEALDAYVPSITAGAGIGQAYGYSPQPPTLAEVSAGSLIYNGSQFAYIRSARAGVRAAQLALEDTREAVAQDTALAFVALDHDQQRQKAIQEQAGFADNLVTIVQQRADAGQDSQIDLTEAKLTAAQLRLAALKTEDDIVYDREHLARLIGVAPGTLLIDGVFPTPPISLDSSPDAAKPYLNAGVASAFAAADAKLSQAKGDARFRFWPQISLVSQYNRYATFTDSFAALQRLNTLSNGQTTLRADEGAFGVQISLPILDKNRSAKARASLAEATRALADANSAQLDALDGESHLRHTLDELRAQAEVAALDQQLAQQRLDVVRVQLQSGNGNLDAPQLSPKDEEKARISERDKYLSVLDASYQLQQAEIQLLRQTGDLESWLTSETQKPNTAQR